MDAGQQCIVEQTVGRTCLVLLPLPLAASRMLAVSMGHTPMILAPHLLQNPSPLIDQQHVVQAWPVSLRFIAYASGVAIRGFVRLDN